VLRYLLNLRGAGARVLIYHRFDPARRDAVERQFAHLRRYYRPTSLTELGAMLADGVEPPRGTVVVTADDGYRDFYRVAYPLLRKYRIPATLFVSTGFVDGLCPLWVDRVTWCLGRGAGARGLKEGLKMLDPQARDAQLAELEAVTGKRLPHPVPPEFEACKWDELREMAANGIEIGAHTVTHPILSRLQDPAFEMLESKRRIEEELQRPVPHFAYPNGLWRDFGVDAVRIARAHFATAVSAEPGWNHAGTDRHQLYRTPASPEDKLGAFARRLAGLRAASRVGQLRPA